MADCPPGGPSPTPRTVGRPLFVTEPETQGGSPGADGGFTPEAAMFDGVGPCRYNLRVTGREKGPGRASVPGHGSSYWTVLDPPTRAWPDDLILYASPTPGPSAIPTRLGLDRTVLGAVDTAVGSLTSPEGAPQPPAGVSPPDHRDDPVRTFWNSRDTAVRLDCTPYWR